MDDQYTWNGKTIATCEYNHKLRPDENIVHDMAHYIVAPKRRRKLPEFGLGSSSDLNTRNANSTLSYKNRQAEEEEASLLGILIEKRIRLKPLMTFTNHNWKDTDDTLGDLLRRYRDGNRETIGCKALQRLQRKGHLDDNLRPVVLS